MSDFPFEKRYGWILYLHPAFRVPYENLILEVSKLSGSDPENVTKHPKAKILKRVNEIILEEIPSDPTHSRYLLGSTLGKDAQHWRRAKFLQRFRILFRFNSKLKIIVYVWLNDENTLRKSGSKTDPYSIFKKRLQAGNPPNEWEELLREVQENE